ncbi:hypothetical protein AB0K16_04265 [Nonomuraea jabiensis]|uniref:hypothetical protein n=1 Tax=Nonomuraea jabiensis TaxID=882448 RepID=UPI00344706A9
MNLDNDVVVTVDPATGATKTYDLRSSHTAFDLEKGTGHCFEETDRDKPVQLTMVAYPHAK